METPETITIKISVYEKMLEQYFDAVRRIEDLELEIFELQEEIEELKQEKEYM